GQHGRRGGAHFQIDGDLHPPAREIDVLRWVGGHTVAAHPDPVEHDIQPRRIELCPGGAHRGENTSPVRVTTVHRTLEQIAACHRASDLESLLLGDGVADLDGDVVFGTL